MGEKAKHQLLEDHHSNRMPPASSPGTTIVGQESNRSSIQDPPHWIAPTKDEGNGTDDTLIGGFWERPAAGDKRSEVQYNVSTQSFECLHKMAEAMLKEDYKGSLQSLDNFINKENASCNGDVLIINERRHERSEERDPVSPSNKRVKHDTHVSVIHFPERSQRKVSTSVTAKQVIEGISMAISKEDRRDAICTAIASFDHNMQSLHDEELELGADSVLVKHIGFIMSQNVLYPELLQSAWLYEMSCTFEALELVLRASPVMVCQSFERFGRNLLELVVHIINQEMTYRVSSKRGKGDSSSSAPDCSDGQDSQGEKRVNQVGSSSDNDTVDTRIPPMCQSIAEEGNRRDGDVLLKKTTKTLGHFARVGAATQPMAYYPGLLSCLVNILLLSPAVSVPGEVRLNSLWILANLACNSENMIMMLCHPSLMNVLVAAAAKKVPEDGSNGSSVEEIFEVLRARSIASRAIVNLSWAPENRIPMSENAALLDALAPLCIRRDSPFARGRTIKGVILQTRRHTLSALSNLASAPRRSKVILCNHGSGLLLNVLTDAALNDPDMSVKQKAFATIRKLAHHDTAELMIQNPALVLALKDALLVAEDSIIKRDASQTLTELERSVSSDMACYKTLQELLCSLNPSPSSSSSAPPNTPLPEEILSSDVSMSDARTTMETENKTFMV